MLPQVSPRMHNLLGSGFSFIAYLIAQIFSSVRLLPANHPYLLQGNVGRFSIRHTVFEAWRHLTFDWRHIDQVLIFFVILGGLIILVMQVALLFIGIFTMSSALALSMPAYFDTMFITPNPLDDIAFITMDRVFGIPDLFNSCVAMGVPCFAGTQYNPENIIVDPMFPTPFHIAFHQFLSAYSYGLMYVAAIIIVYFVITVVGETAQTGTPFGQRFNHVWAPLRLVVALGLLIPTASGLNSAQYIVLYAAKFGSSFATNGWNMFLTGAGLPGGGLTILGTPDTLVGIPEAPPVNSLLEYGSSLGACIITQRFFYNREIKGYLVNPSGMNAAASRIDLDTDPTYDQALAFSNYGDLYFVFGEYKEEANGQPFYTGHPAFIKPWCGEVVMQITDVADAYSPGSRVILELYYLVVVQLLWQDAVSIAPTWSTTLSLGGIGNNAVRKHVAGYPGHDTTINVAETTDLEIMRIGYQAYVEAAIQIGLNMQRAAPSWAEMDDYGWAGAGIWYNKIAELNGMMVGAVNALPIVRSFPQTMEDVKKEREKYDQDMSGPERYMPRRSDGTEITLKDTTQYKEAEAMYAAYKVWGDKMSVAKPTGNIFVDAIHAFFGTKGLYNMAKNTDVHPLAQLVGVGKSLVESSIRNLGASAFAGLAGGLANIMGFHNAGNFASVASSIVSKIAMFGLTAGFLLFYVVPFMPFLYFFFAMGVWVKTILEAMVGVPLWALAHLRIDGNGLPGSAAMSGYYLIFEVFLRPICIVFGLLAAVAIFGAQVKILHQIWPLVTSNMTGFEADSLTPPAPDQLGGVIWFRGLVDQFFFTLIYTFIVYMMALASFKLIDLVPDYIMRWMGSSVATFGDIYKDEVSALPSRAAIGVGAVMQQVGSAAKQGGDALKHVAASATKGGGQ